MSRSYWDETTKTLRTIVTSSEGTTSIFSDGNSSVIPLANGATFTGVGELNTLPDVMVFGKSDQNGTLYLQFSGDGTNWDTSILVVYTANGGLVKKFIKGVRYFRIVFTNNSGNPQTFFRFYTTYGVFGAQLTRLLSTNVQPEDDCILSRSVIAGALPNGSYQNVFLGVEGSLGVDIRNSRTAFGELSVQTPVPIVQEGFHHFSLVNQKVETFLGGTGTVSIVNSKARCEVQTLGDFAVLRTVKRMNYRQGQGGLARFTAVFSAGQANVSQIIGLGNVSNGFFVGMLGTGFGIRHRRYGELHMIKLVVTAAATSGGNVTVNLGTGVLGAVSESVPVTNAAADLSFTAYEIAKHTYPQFIGAFNIGTSVYFIPNRVEPRTGDISFGAAVGVTATISTVNTGVSATNTDIAQASFNIDTLDGLGPSGIIFNPLVGNVFQVQMQWLGFGAITFFIENSVTGEYIPFHRIRYANSSNEVSVRYPNMPLEVSCYGEGAHTPSYLETASLSMFIEGVIKQSGPFFSKSINVTNISANTERPIISILCPRFYGDPSFGEKTNYTDFVFKNLSVASDSQKPVEIRVYLNSTLSPVPSTANYPEWQYIEQNQSAAQYDVNATTFTAGSLILAYNIGKADSIILSMDEFQIQTGEMITITANTSNATNDITVTVNWLEDV